MKFPFSITFVRRRRLCTSKMKSRFLPLYTLAIMHIRACGSFDTVKLTAVSSFPELDQFYRHVKLEPELWDVRPSEQKDDTTTKLQICHFIFRSAFFDMSGEDPVRLNSADTFKLLSSKPEYRKIFHEVYGSGGVTTSKKVFKRFFSFGRDDEDPLPPRYYDDNVYRERKVWIQGYPTRERVFVCLTRERRTGNIKQYFVSNVYNMNKYFTTVLAIAGCFIFTHDRRDDIILRALAEEPSEPALLLFTTMERLYAYRREFLRPANTAEEDPVCQLTKSKKLRLCNQIFSGSEFNDLIRFYPAFVNVEERCVKRRVDFDEPDVRARSRDVIHEEWMIGCKTLLIGEGLLEEKTFYVSRGYSSGAHSVNLYGELDGHLYIIYYTYHLSVWVNRFNL